MSSQRAAFKDRRQAIRAGVLIPLDSGEPWPSSAGPRDMADMITGDFGSRLIDGKWQGFLSGIEFARTSAGTNIDGSTTALCSVAFQGGEAARIPLIHGKEDTVVPFTHSDSMAAALRSANKPHELVVLRDEDHWLSRPETRKQMLEATMRFVIAHNPPD